MSEQVTIDPMVFTSGYQSSSGAENGKDVKSKIPKPSISTMRPTVEKLVLQRIPNDSGAFQKDVLKKKIVKLSDITNQQIFAVKSIGPLIKVEKQDEESSNLPDNLKSLVFNNNKSKVPRPPNAFMLFSKENRPAVCDMNPELNNQNVSKTLGNMWLKMDQKGKDKYYNQSRALEKLHKTVYPNYMYNPCDARVKKKMKIQRNKATNRSNIEANRFRKSMEYSAIAAKALNVPLKAPTHTSILCGSLLDEINDDATLKSASAGASDKKKPLRRSQEKTNSNESTKDQIDSVNTSTMLDEKCPTPPAFVSTSADPFKSPVYWPYSFPLNSDLENKDAVTNEQDCQYNPTAACTPCINPNPPSIFPGPICAMPSRFPFHPAVWNPWMLYPGRPAYFCGPQQFPMIPVYQSDPRFVCKVDAATSTENIEDFEVEKDGCKVEASTNTEAVEEIEVEADPVQFGDSSDEDEPMIPEFDQVYIDAEHVDVTDDEDERLVIAEDEGQKRKLK